MDGPGRAAEPSVAADDGAGEPRWSPAPEKSTDRPAEPRCGTPSAGPQPTPTGLPTLLAYRPESSQANVHHEAEEDAEPTCEYCGNPLRPFPFCEDGALSEHQEDRFCCQRSRELYEFIVRERKRLEDASSLPRAVSTQESLGSEANLLLPKEQDSHRLHREVARQVLSEMLIPVLADELSRDRQQKRHLARELAEQSLRLNAIKGSQQAGFVSYEPSQELASPEGGTPVPLASAAEPKPEPEPQPKEKPKPEPEPQPKEKPEPEHRPEEEPKEEPWPEEEPELEPRPEEEPELEEPESRPGEEPELQEEPKHDKKAASRSVLCYEFSLLGKKVGKGKLVQKYYKNGKKFLTMLPDGTSQLFYPSGNLAIIITQARDQLMCIVQEDERRTAKIRALFQSDGRSTCYYPTGDEWILAQDKIFVSFLAMGRQAKLNMGTKVQVSTDSQLPPAARLGEDELLLLAFRVRILQLFERMRGCLNFPSSEQWNKMQPPIYLISQAMKILELCMAADISDELRSSIKAIVNAQQL